MTHVKHDATGQVMQLNNRILCYIITINVYKYAMFLEAEQVEDCVSRLDLRNEVVIKTYSIWKYFYLKSSVNK